MSRRDKRKATRQRIRRDNYYAAKLNVAESLGYDPDATMATHDPTYMLVKEHPDHGNIATRSDPIDANDTTLQTYKRVTGDKSALIYCVDTTQWSTSATRNLTTCDTSDIVFVVKITLFCDMEPTRRDHYQWMFHYLAKDKVYKPPIKTNHAQLGESTLDDAATRRRFDTTS